MLLPSASPALAFQNEFCQVITEKTKFLAAKCRSLSPLSYRGNKRFICCIKKNEKKASAKWYVKVRRNFILCCNFFFVVAIEITISLLELYELEILSRIFFWICVVNNIRIFNILNALLKCSLYNLLQINTFLNVFKVN